MTARARKKEAEQANRFALTTAEENRQLRQRIAALEIQLDEARERYENADRLRGELLAQIGERERLEHELAAARGGEGD